MTFQEVLAQVIDWLKREQRLSYRALKRQFDLDDDYIEDLTEELIYSKRLAVDEDGRVLVWTGEAATPLEPMSTAQQPTQPDATRKAQRSQTEPSPTQPPTPDAERRQLTVMFCDLADSTKLSGQLDPEDLRDVIRAYQETAAGVIQRYEGHIAQYLGDGLLVYFGWPQAHEDDAQRGVHTGVGIVEAMDTLNTRLEKEKGVRLAVRIGIHTGPVVIGEMGGGGRHEQLALGETTNIASRLEGMAQPNTVVISDTTYRLVEGYFRCDDLGMQSLKGVATPVQTHRANQATGIQGRLDTAMTRGLTPLVGRESEVSLLRERWAQVQDGQGQVLLLSGEAGIGKSRLLQVMRQHVANEPHTRLECRSSPYYQNSALYPITEMLQRLLMWQQDETPQEKLDKLEQTLRAYPLDLGEAIPLFATLLSLPIPEDRYPLSHLSPQRQRQKTIETIVAMLLELAELQPVLFILEDLHWTDPSTLEVLDLVIEQVPTAALYVLLTCRPTFQPTWSPRSYLAHVTLNRLAGDQIERMAVQVAGGKRLPAEVLQQIVEKTDGVPLYVEEMTKSVLESRILKEVNGHYDLVGTLSSLAIPATLQDSLMARLDRLVTAKAVAQYAAVIGRQFSYELLQAVSQLDKMTLQRELGRLVETELVFQRGLPPQAIYTFKHALVQDAAYASLLKSTRQQYHQRIAQTLEDQFLETAETQPELLAHHFTEAGLNEQAVDYWHKTGQRAIERFAHVEAIAHLSTGLDLLKMLPDTSERDQKELVILTVLGLALMETKGQSSREAEHAYSRARVLCEQLEETSFLYPVLSGLHRVYHTRAEFHTASNIAQQYLAAAHDQHDILAMMDAKSRMGVSLLDTGELAASHQQLEEGIALYTSRQDYALLMRHPTISCLTYSAITLWLLGYPERALERLHEALVKSQERFDVSSLMIVQIATAIVHQFRREAQLTQAWAEKTVSLATEQGMVFWLPYGMVLQGWAGAVQGRFEEGIGQMSQGMATWYAMGTILRRTYFLALLGETYRTYGHVEDGLRMVEEALTLVQKTGERFYEAELHRLRGELLLQLSSDNATEAETFFHKALDVARHRQAKSWELRAATSLARLRQQQGKRDEAWQVLAEVYNWFTEGFDTADLKDTKALLDELS